MIDFNFDFAIATICVHICGAWLYDLWTSLVIFFLLSSGFVCDIFHKAFVMEQKDEIEAVFDKTSYDWKNRLASPIKAKYLFKVETC